MKYFKKIGLLAGILGISLFALVACDDKREKEEDKLTIVTTLFPNYDFAKQIAGDKAEVTLLLDPGVESHDYDPSPSDIIAINKADIFIYTGDYMEIWAKNIIESLESETVKIVDASKDIKLIPSEEEDGHDHGYDPHIWTSPKNAMTMMNTILNAIIQADPENRNYYEKNAAAYISEIQKIDTEIREVVSNTIYQTIYFGGRFAMIYFVKEYGLGYMSAFDSCSSETEPSAKLVADIVKVMKGNGAKVVFYEELTDPKSAVAIAEEVGGEVLLLHSCHNVSAEEFEGGATYVSLMKQNIENLKIGLGEK